MTDRLKHWWLLGLFILPALACNAFAGRVDTSLPPPATLTPNVAIDENETTPIIAPTVTLPADSSIMPLQGTIRILVDLNIRSGPGVQFDRVGFLPRDEIVSISGRDEVSGWWQIQCPPSVESAQCWVSGGPRYTQIEAIQPTPTP
jgi:hypothetical protein